MEFEHFLRDEQALYVSAGFPLLTTTAAATQNGFHQFFTKESMMDVDMVDADGIPSRTVRSIQQHIPPPFSYHLSNKILIETDALAACIQPHATPQPLASKYGSSCSLSFATNYITVSVEINICSVIENSC